MNNKERKPARKPANAKGAILLIYHPNEICSNPITTTPAADPMINKLPPVPALNAIICQTDASKSCVNIPILAATNGTLSTTAEKTPIKNTNNRI